MEYLEQNLHEWLGEELEVRLSVAMPVHLLKLTDRTTTQGLLGPGTQHLYTP
jgi:hypothetical protein